MYFSTRSPLRCDTIAPQRGLGEIGCADQGDHELLQVGTLPVGVGAAIQDVEHRHRPVLLSLAYNFRVTPAIARAIAVSVAGFSPLVAVLAATLPLFQAVFLIGYMRLARRSERYYGGCCA